MLSYSLKRCRTFHFDVLWKKIQLDLINSRARLNAILQLISCVILLVRNGNVCEGFFSSAIYWFKLRQLLLMIIFFFFCLLPENTDERFSSCVLNIVLHLSTIDVVEKSEQVLAVFPHNDSSFLKSTCMNLLSFIIIMFNVVVLCVHRALFLVFY